MKTFIGLVSATLLLASLGGTAHAEDGMAAGETKAPIGDEPVQLQAVAKKEFREPGRFGIFAGVTDDGFQFGLARASHYYEAVLTADGSFAGRGPATGDLGLTLHAGPRVALSTYNYVSLGGSFHASVLGKEDGVSTMGSFTVGPYVGLQRHFAGSNLMINVWVLPYAFEQHVGNDGAGEKQTTFTHHFFQNGGFGLAYLF